MYTGTSQRFPTGEEKPVYRGNKLPKKTASLPTEENSEVISKSDLPETASRNRLMKIFLKKKEEKV